MARRFLRRIARARYRSGTVRRSVTGVWLATCAALYAAGLACSNSTPNLPPIEASGNPGASCGLGNSCHDEGAYCIGDVSACKYLECVGGSWACPPDASVSFDAGMHPGDSGGAEDAAEASDGAGAVDATGDAVESGGDAAGD